MSIKNVIIALLTLTVVVCLYVIFGSGRHAPAVSVEQSNHDVAVDEVAPMPSHSGHSMTVASEREFIEQMIPHHQEAVDTAKEVMERGGTTPEVRALVAGIIEAQEKEIAMMKAWHEEWYGEPYVDAGTYVPMMRELEALRGSELDRAFLEDMIGHHEGAVVMAQGVQAHVEHEVLRAFAQAIVTTQTEEISLMRTYIQPRDIPETSGASLDLSERGLTHVSQDTFKRTELTSLDLSHNALTGALPAEVRHLVKLERLDLSHNKFTGVPAEVGQLRELRYLDLSYNQLTGLPYEIGNLKKLEVLDLTGNDYAKADLAKIKEGLPAGVRILGE